MEDSAIVELYLQRNETAISETDVKYGRYLSKIAYNILADIEDSKESVNETYLRAWNSIPPRKPCVLSTYLGKITRQLSIDIFRRKNSQKRRSEYTVSLSELEDISAGNVTENEADLHLLAKAIGGYLRTQSEEVSSIFIARYYFMDSVREIAACNCVSEAKVKSILHRARIGLKAYLEKEGIL